GATCLRTATFALLLKGRRLQSIRSHAHVRGRSTMSASPQMPPTHEPPSLADWLSTPLGRRCLANEQRLMRRALERVFGEMCLQIGGWGSRNAFLRYARTQRRALVGWRAGSGADLISDTEQLAIASDSVDAVLLPHTLEQTPSPHALLREVVRILRPDGH